jgi:hypothetical protein
MLSSTHTIIKIADITIVKMVASAVSEGDAAEGLNASSAKAVPKGKETSNITIMERTQILFIVLLYLR